MSSFRKALMITAIPLVALSLVSIAGGVMASGWEWVVWVRFLGAFLVMVAIIAATIFYFTGRKGIASGMLAGIGIGIVALGVSCFAPIAVAYW